MATPVAILDTSAAAAAAHQVKRSSRGQRAALPTVLVSMPFMEVDRPSIQLGLLRAIGVAHDFPVRTLHANLDFAARVGVKYYRLLCERRQRMLADWLFSVEAFGDSAPDQHGGLIDEIADELSYLGGSPADRRDQLMRTRTHDVPAYLDDLVESFPWDGVRVVGFTSTFQQNTASFALARRLKARLPGIVTVFGGANFDGEMGREWVRSVDCVDFAVIGEGDVAFPALLDALAAGADPGTIPGVARRVDGATVATPPMPPLRLLDDLPAPDYDEYFERAEALGLQERAGHRRVWLPFESARGCWWGEKHHCTFCGLNGSNMVFRAKSPERVAAELAAQARRYRNFRFEAVDNILDMDYLRRLFPELIASGATYELFYEIKANLTRDQFRLLGQAGVTQVQPGLESLSSRVLGLMRKGVRAAQNVNVLRWGAYYGIKVSWNLLWGFPGEAAEDYQEQAEVLPHLVHLQPPAGTSRIWLERFSPLYTEASSGVRMRTPELSYRYVYPSAVDLDRAAYFFEYEMEDALPDSAYTGVSDAVDAWQAARDGDGKPPVLKFWSAPGFVQIYDARRPGAEGTYTFEGDLADVYRLCSDRPITASAVAERLEHRLPVEGVQEAFDEFGKRGLMFLDGTLGLALALPAGATH
jgi:ribosomal peptide maturation radical SAM protein 1